MCIRDSPRNVGEIENASGIGTVGNAKCGDIMRIYLDIDDDRIIRDVKFKTFGCGAAVATSSMATELVKGKSIYEALKVTNQAVMEALDGLPPVKVHCSLLAEEAILSLIHIEMCIRDRVSDDDMVLMARDIAKQIEFELEYPGQIKVNVIRESRATDYAK